LGQKSLGEEDLAAETLRKHINVTSLSSFKNSAPELSNTDLSFSFLV
jgi:hypothetical protein